MSNASASAIQGSTGTDQHHVISYVGVVGQYTSAPEVKKVTGSSGSTLIERPMSDAPPCRMLDGLSALLLTLAALSAMTVGWVGTMRHQADEWSARIGPATLMTIGIAGTIAATRLLQSMTIG